ncbi:uncharacterized protein A1O5_08013 [Cladophialophora psammophila CBS 110553]|uniref:Uncharacterized protein n=1 Tax=Cladophialophora psammophila CBS 110553 TaxID=1182543 RepID=W9WMG2_9EURO|nr:uncharacterized protein A1O5_08013 [Cladophialophora psammophila CBS 110553]EXJ69078.1 hypothetical protein A1O5_08013 [Cladophialophora psammophila CBS 110553]
MAKTPTPVAKDVNPSSEDTLTGGKYSNSGSKTTAKELMKMFLDEVRDSLHQACTLAKEPAPRWPSIVEHLNRAVLRVRMLESVYLPTVHELHQEQRELRDTWEYFMQLKNETIKHLSWLEDPLDPSTKLAKITDPQDFGRLVEARFRAMNDQVDTLSKEKTELEARFGVVVTNHNLQLDCAEKSATETKRVLKDNDRLKAAKKDLETKLEDQKNATIRAEDARDVLSKENMDLERELARLRVAYPAQQEVARQAQREKDAALEKVVDLREQLEALQREFSSQVNAKVQAEKDRSALSHDLTKIISNLEAELSTKTDSIEHLQRNHDELAEEKKSYEERLATLEDQLRVKTENAIVASHMETTIKTWQDKHSQARQRLEDKELEIMRLQDEIAQAEQRLKERELEIARLQDDLALTKQTVTELPSDLHDREGNLKEKVQQLRARTERAELRAGKCTSALTEQQKQAEAAREKCEQARTDATDLRLKSNRDDEKIRILNRQATDLSEDMNRWITRKADLLNDVRSLNSNSDEQQNGSSLEVSVPRPPDAGIQTKPEELNNSSHLQNLPQNGVCKSRFLAAMSPNPSRMPLPSKRGSIDANIPNDRNLRDRKRPRQSSQ